MLDPCSVIDDRCAPVRCSHGAVRRLGHGTQALRTPHRSVATTLLVGSWSLMAPSSCQSRRMSSRHRLARLLRDQQTPASSPLKLHNAILWEQNSTLYSVDTESLGRAMSRPARKHQKITSSRYQTLWRTVEKSWPLLASSANPLR